MAASLSLSIYRDQATIRKDQRRRTADTKLVTQLVVIQNRRVAGGCRQLFPLLGEGQGLFTILEHQTEIILS